MADHNETEKLKYAEFTGKPAVLSYISESDGITKTYEGTVMEMCGHKVWLALIHAQSLSRQRDYSKDELNQFTLSLTGENKKIQGKCRYVTANIVFTDWISSICLACYSESKYEIDKKEERHRA